MLSGAEVHGLGWAPYERRSELVRFGLRTRLVPTCRTHQNSSPIWPASADQASIQMTDRPRLAEAWGSLVVAW